MGTGVSLCVGAGLKHSSPRSDSSVSVLMVCFLVGRNSEEEQDRNMIFLFYSLMQLLSFSEHPKNVSFSPVLPPAALKCPSGSHYTPCGPACPQPSCQDPTGPDGPCDQPCVEGCLCDTGLILSGNKCVPLSECGCTDENGLYKPVGAPDLKDPRVPVIFPESTSDRNSASPCTGWRHLVHRH